MIFLELDPDVVKPGWTPLIITVLLAIAVVLLYFSMRRQFRKISIPPEETEEEPRPTPKEPRPTPKEPRPTPKEPPATPKEPPAGSSAE